MKLSKDMKITSTYLEATDTPWIPQCVYWSRSTRDLLVGIWRMDSIPAKVTRYNQTGQLTETLEQDNTGRELYSYPGYITENINGDVIVSDYKTLGLGSVVVTSREGIYRFSYEGHPSGSGLMPWAICADALSHILVCDENTHTVHLIDRDGRFLSYLLIRPQGVFTPRSLGYDVTTQRLWVGSDIRQRVCVYRTGKVTRFNQNGKPTKTIQYDNTGQELYSNPKYITGNNNGDVVVADSYSAVVVTDYEGRYRFSYTGCPSGSGLQPWGVCTDALSHILVCDVKTHTVQMLDCNGQFLSHLLTKSKEIGIPHSLGYDINTYCLWVGSSDKKVFVYKIINLQNNLQVPIKPNLKLEQTPTKPRFNKYRFFRRQYGNGTHRESVDQETGFCDIADDITSSYDGGGSFIA
uniref:Tripartite motif-containing protein 2 n=1 Tax=Magallana gigas TaxID=29159 RepID=K1Q323_MAGGI